MAEGCGLKLRRTGRKTSCLELTLIYSDGLSARRTASISAPTDDDLTLFAKTRDLFWKTCGRRISIRSLRLVCCRLKELESQMDLFTDVEGVPDTDMRTRSLQGAVDRVRERFGMDAVRWGRCAPQVQSPESRVQRKEHYDV